MTEYIVKVADISWQRHSTSIYLGNFRTKRQKEDGEWLDRLEYDDGELAISDGYRFGSAGLWVTDDYLTDRVAIWRPPYAVDIKRIAMIVGCDIISDASNYYHFDFLNPSSNIVGYLYTSATSLLAWTFKEVTLNTIYSRLSLAEALTLEITDVYPKSPIIGLTVVIDYEPSV
jgi:hypothetical protein